MDQFSVQQGSPAVSVSSQSGPGAVNNNSEAAPAFQPDENSKTLYVGNLDQSVNENFLREIFSQSGALVESVKIIRDKNVGVLISSNAGVLLVKFSSLNALFFPRCSLLTEASTMDSSSLLITPLPRLPCRP